MAVQMTKSQLIEKIAVTNEVAKKDVKGVMATLATIGYSELKKNGVFLVPGFAKFVVIKKPATTGAAVGTAAAIATAPFRGSYGYDNRYGYDEGYARRNGFVCQPGTLFRGEDGRRHLCQ
jgi:nucleoid DNA-binding protein